VPIHDFSQSVVDYQNPLTSQQPAQYPIGLEQSADLNTPPLSAVAGAKPGFTDMLTGRGGWTLPVDERDYQEPAFRPLEEALKMYWSGIRVPCKDGYRMLRIKIAGQSRPLAIWRDDLLNGRAVLPVGSIARSNFTWDKERYAPPFHPMAYRYVNGEGSAVALVYKPTPVLVNYTLTVVSETKRDDGYVMTTVMRRFQSGVIEFIVKDGHTNYVARGNFDGGDNQTEGRLDDGARGFIVTAYKMVVEAYLPLPERVLPTVLAVNNQFRLPDGTVLDTTPNLRL
jgi:hypothetical protein